jgi:hypothetical protein
MKGYLIPFDSKMPLGLEDEKSYKNIIGGPILYFPNKGILIYRQDYLGRIMDVEFFEDDNIISKQLKQLVNSTLKNRAIPLNISDPEVLDIFSKAKTIYKTKEEVLLNSLALLSKLETILI